MRKSPPPQLANMTGGGGEGGGEREGKGEGGGEGREANIFPIVFSPDNTNYINVSRNIH